MEFCFIDNNTALRPLALKRVRAHALKGKNLGKSIPARGHRRRQCEKEAEPRLQIKETSQSNPYNNYGRPLLPKPSKDSFDNDATYLMPKSSPWTYFCGTELSYFVTADRLTSSSQYLIHEFHHALSQTLYPVSFCRTSQQTETSWFILMMDNPCEVFHCGLAMTSAHISGHINQRDTTFESIRHFMEAMRLLRRELSSSTSPTLSSLIVMVSLAIHANLTDTLHESRTHLLALKHIIDTQLGGLVLLCESEPEIGNKVRRADLHLALSEGTPTLFGSRWGHLPATLHVVPLPKGKLSIEMPNPLGNTAQALQASIRDVLTLCSYSGSRQLDGFQYQNLVISITQRLADYEALSDTKPQSVLNKVCQLGFLAFMSTLLHHGEQRPVCSALLSEKLREGLDRFIDDTKERDELQTFQLWLLFVYAIAAEKYDVFGDTSSLLTPRLHSLVQELNIEGWENVKTCLCKYAWIAEFHDEAGSKFWNSIACV